MTTYTVLWGAVLFHDVYANQGKYKESVGIQVTLYIGLAVAFCVFVTAIICLIWIAVTCRKSIRRKATEANNSRNELTHTGDMTLATSAQRYHFTHQKQQTLSNSSPFEEPVVKADGTPEHDALIDCPGPASSSQCHRCAFIIPRSGIFSENGTSIDTLIETSNA
ncbi:unnamed protein product [Dicrocoelium dendriticum]|nr:unnamed protein product [Dicrocoelium dendriticum]